MIERFSQQRRWLIATAASSALLTLREASAQTAAEGGDWLRMIEQHHGLIERAFQELLARNDAPWEQRNLQMLNLHQVLKAHQLAEEHVIYPAAVRAGLQSQTDQLYRQEAEAKVMTSQLRLLALAKERNPAWIETARQLQKAVLHHAREEEEKNVYPQLKQRLDAAENRRLSELYPLEFSSVIPVRR